MIGKRFGRLLVISSAGSDVCPSGKRTRRLWLCACDCGNTKKASTGQLNSANIRSCGCMRQGVNKTHGQSSSRTFMSWVLMRGRCYRKGNNRFQYYGGRGIRVCDKWRDSFESFLSDMGERPKGKTLDRKNNNGDYTPENCKWSTPKEQAANRRPRAYTT